MRGVRDLLFQKETMERRGIFPIVRDDKPAMVSASPVEIAKMGLESPWSLLFTQIKAVCAALIELSEKADSSILVCAWEPPSTQLKKPIDNFALERAAFKPGKRSAEDTLRYKHTDRPRAITLGVDKGFDTSDFVNHAPSWLRREPAHPQAHRRSVRLDDDDRRHAAADSARHRLCRVGFTFAAAAYNLVRLPKLLTATA